MTKKVSCLKCKYYFSTFEAKMPRGCRLYQIKSTRFPSIVVKEESQQECLGYEPRVKSENKLDLNDNKYW